MIDTFFHRLFRLEAAENFMRRLTSPQTLDLSHYQYLVYAYSGIGDEELRSAKNAFLPRKRRGESVSGVENCNREGVLGGTFPSLPTVCSFRAATPYLQVQCLLSLIHIPWPTHPYYPWLSTGLRTPSLSKPIPAYIASRVESHSYVLLVPFRSFYMREYAYMYTYTYICRCNDIGG